MTRHELLEIRLPRRLPIDECLRHDLRSINRALAAPRPDESLAPALYFGLHSSLNGLCAHHLEYPGVESPHEWADRGVALALEYFFGDWWVTCPRYYKRKEDSIDRTQWIEYLEFGLVLGTLADRWEDIARLCNWVHGDLECQWPGYEKELIYVYLLIAESIRGQPLERASEFRRAVLKSRVKRPRLLLAALDAALADDAPVLKENLSELLKRFDKTVPTEYGADLVRLFPLPEIVIYNFGLHRGMQPLEFPPRLAARLITRESLGLQRITSGV